VRLVILMIRSRSLIRRGFSVNQGDHSKAKHVVTIIKSLCADDQVCVETLHAMSLRVARTYCFKAKKRLIRKLMVFIVSSSRAIEEDTKRIEM